MSRSPVMLDGGLVHHYEHRRDTSSNAAARLDAERVLEDLSLAVPRGPGV